MRREPPPRAQAGWLWELTPVPLLGGVRAEEPRDRPLRKAEPWLQRLTRAPPRAEGQVWTGHSRPTAALMGPAPASRRGSGLTALRLPHPPAQEHMALGTAGQGASDHKQPPRSGA